MIKLTKTPILQKLLFFGITVNFEETRENILHIFPAWKLSRLFGLYIIHILNIWRKSMHAYSFLFQDILDFCHFLKVKSYHGFDQNSLFVVSSLHWFDLLDNFGKGFANLAKNFSRGFPNGPKMKKKRQGHSFFNLVYYETANITWNSLQLQNLGIVPNTFS